MSNEEKKYKALCKKLNRIPTPEEANSSGVFSYHRMKQIGGILKYHEELSSKDKLLNKYKNKQDNDSKVMGENILSGIAEFVNENKKYPSVRDIAKRLNISRSSIHRRCDGGFDLLLKESKKLYPECFENVIDETIFNDERYSDLKKEIKIHKRFFITTAVVDSPINEDFYNTIKLYCKENEAMLLILPANNNLEDLDSSLIHENIVFNDVRLNDNLFISTIKLSPKQINPLTGLKRIGQRNGSFVYASPKQFLEFVATAKNKLPHAMMTTGALTIPKYLGKKYSQFRTDYIANNDHVMGGIIVEIQDNKTFHFRQVQCYDDGSFYDLGKHYSQDGSSFEGCEALVLGDLHSIQKDVGVFEKWIELIKEIKPKKVILHDVFDSLSVSHHNEDKNLLRAKLSGLNLLSLEMEVSELIKDLKTLSALVEKVIVVKSNHDEHLTRYLEDGRFMRDPQNCKFAINIAKGFLDGNDPVKYACEVIGYKPENVIWLTRDQDYYIENIQCGSHGDLGANGSRGSIATMENAHGSCIFAHGHSPAIVRGAWRVGTTSLLHLDYNKGDSSWVHSAIPVYKGGMRQNINVIEGRYKA